MCLNGVGVGPKMASHMLFIADVSTVIQPTSVRMTAYKSLTLLYFLTLWEVLPYLDQVIVSWILTHGITLGKKQIGDNGLVQR